MELFLGIDIKYIYIAAGIVALAGLIAIIKKVFKLGIAILVISILFTYGGRLAHSFQEKYNFKVEGTKVYMVIDDREHSIDFNVIESIDAFDTGGGMVNLDITTDRGGKVSIKKVPRFIFNGIKKPAEKSGITIIEK